MSNNTGFIFPPPPPPPPRASGQAPNTQNTGYRNFPPRGRGHRGGHTPGNNRGRGWHQNNRSTRGAHSSTRGNGRGNGAAYPSTNSQNHGSFTPNVYGQPHTTGQPATGPSSTANGLPQIPPSQPWTGNLIQYAGMMQAMQAMADNLRNNTSFQPSSGFNANPQALLGIANTFGPNSLVSQQLPAMNGAVQQNWGDMAGLQQTSTATTTSPQEQPYNGLPPPDNANHPLNKNQRTFPGHENPRNHSRGSPRGEATARKQYTAAPAVPNFSAIPLPPKPPVQPAPNSGQDDNDRLKKKPKTNLFGLTPRTVEPEDSDDEEEQEQELDEEQSLGQQIASTGNQLRFEYKGQVSTLTTQADIAAWIAERRSKYPTKQRVREKQEERERRVEEAKKRRQKEEQERREKRDLELELELELAKKMQREGEGGEGGEGDLELVRREETKVVNGNKKAEKGKTTKKLKGKQNPRMANANEGTSKGRRKGLYQRMLENDQQKEHELVLDAIQFLGDRGLFKRD